jgi:hypothetical protein
MAGLATLVFSCLSVCQTPMRLDRRDAGASGGLRLGEILTILLFAPCGLSERQRTGPSRAQGEQECLSHLTRRDAGVPGGIGLCEVLTSLLCARCGESERQRTGRIACPTKGARHRIGPSQAQGERESLSY